MARLAEVRTEFAKGCFEAFREYPGFSDNRHEIRIANPAGNNVHVKVMLHPGSGTTAEIHSDIEAIRMVGLLQSELAPLNQLHNLSRLLRRAFLKISRVRVGGDQKVSRGVRKDVQNYKTRVSPKNHKIPFVVLTRGL